ncbi:MAG: GNAT family N-acetyltransferase [Bacteroidetes bacterium]|nr:GNAT family N-acetyltransferase [Bacteroidota bacterium]
MLSILRFDYSNKIFFKKALGIRTKVFVQEMSIDPKLEYDGFDLTAHHFLLIENNEPIATARWRETIKGIKLERFAVIKEQRGKGIGTLILKEVLKDTIQFSKTIYLHSQHSAVNLYLKNGFEIIGEAFEEAGIRHFYMEYKLSRTK